MTRILEFQISTRLAAPVGAVWAHAASMAGVNRELAPLARMTYPADKARLDGQSLPPDGRLFRSWILLFGLLPVDYDDITLAWLEPHRGFYETSTMFSQSIWRHRRTLEPVEGGTVVTDQVEFRPRIAGTGRLYRAIFRLSFQLRHRNLRRLFGELKQRP